MARSRGTANPVSLFPFLAVLMCTIGALILLLVLISAQLRATAVATRRAEQAEKQKARPEAARQVPDKEPEPQPYEPEIPQLTGTGDSKLPPRASEDDLATLANLESRVQALSGSLRDQRERTQSLRDKADSVRATLQQVTAQGRQLEDAIARARQAGGAAEQRTQELLIETAQMRELIDQSSQLISREKGRLETPEYSIVPYDGQTGTVRRPIIVECVNDEIRFVAEQIAISARRLEPYSPEENPLRAGVTALFGYWVEHDRKNSGNARPGRPYILILVRPSGGEAFFATRVMLDQMVGDFGYELVEDDFRFQAMETTPEAVEACRAAIRNAFALPPTPSRSMPIARVERGVPRTIDSSALVQGGPTGADSFFRSDAFRGRGRSGDEGSGAGSDDAQYAGSGGRSYATTDQPTVAVTGRSRSGLLSGDGPGWTDLSASGAQGTGRSGTEGTAAKLPDSLLNESPSDAFLANAVRGSGTSGRNGSETTGGTGSAPRLLATPPDLDAQLSSGDESPAAPGGTADDRGPGRFNGTTAGLGQSAAANVRDDTADIRTGNQVASDFVSAAVRHGGSGANGGTGAGSGNSASNTSTAGTSQSVVDGGANTAGSSAAGSDSGTAGGSAGGAATPGTGQPTSSAFLNSLGKSGDPNGAAGSGQMLPEIDMPRLRPKHKWGIVNPESSVPLERAITLTVESGRVVLGSRYQISRTDDRTDEFVVQRSVQALEAIAREWGPPPGAFYWTPLVTLKTAAGSEELAAKLEESLKQNDATVKRED